MLFTRTVFIAVLFASSLFAEDVQTWTEIHQKVVSTDRYEVAVDGVLRFAETIGDNYDRRVGSRFLYQASDRIQFELGYVWRREDKQEQTITENRLIAGISYPILRGAFQVEGSSSYEYQMVPASNVNRLRQDFEATWPEKKLAPWIYQDFTFRNGDGFYRSRSRLGIAWAISSGYELRAAYQFESIQREAAWTPRHVIYTELSIDRALWSQE